MAEYSVRDMDGARETAGLCGPGRRRFGKLQHILSAPEPVLDLIAFHNPLLYTAIEVWYDLARPEDMVPPHAQDGPDGGVS